MRTEQNRTEQNRTEQNRTERISWIDVAKGIGIIVIVYGHVLKSGHIRVYLYAFNVVLFFFLLGYTFKCSSSLKKFIKVRFKRTMIPYYVWSVISIMIFLVLAKFVSYDSSEASMSLWKNLLGMLYGNSRTIYMKWNQPLWFIPCMNVTLIVVWLIEKIRIKKFPKLVITFFRLLICIGFSIAGVLMQMFVNIKLPFQFESAVLMVAFVELGLIFRTDKIIEKLAEYKYSTIVTVTLLFVGIIAVNVNGTAGVQTYNYGRYPFLFLISATLLTIVITLVAYKIKSNFILETLGRISLPILLMHKFPILFFQSMSPVTKTLLTRPDTVAGAISSLIVTLITFVMCWVATNVIQRFMPVLIGYPHTFHTNRQMKSPKPSK